MTGTASVLLDTPDAVLYKIQFPNGSFYTDGPYDSWPITSAKPIARNVAKKRQLTVRLVKIEEVVDRESAFDRIVEYVDTLKGKALADEIYLVHKLPKGNDPVASKRQRLIDHLTKCKGH